MLLHSDTTHHTETVIKMDDVCAHVAFSREGGENDFSERERVRKRTDKEKERYSSRTNEVDIKGRQEGERSLVVALGMHQGQWVESQGVYN